MNNWERLVWNQREALWNGLVVTAEVCAIAFAVAILVGLALCLVRMYVKPLRPIAIMLIEFFRATPIVVQPASRRISASVGTLGGMQGSEPGAAARRASPHQVCPFQESVRPSPASTLGVRPVKSEPIDIDV